MKGDKSKEAIGSIVYYSRLGAAKFFSSKKGLELKSFLNIYSVSK